MTGQIVIRSSPATPNRRRPLLAATPPTNSPSPPPRKIRKSSSNVGEVAGGTTAEVFVVCCCCPCVLLEFIVLAVYKVPATVVRRVWKKQRHKLLIKTRREKKNKNKKNIVEHAKEVHVDVNLNVSNKVVYGGVGGGGGGGGSGGGRRQHQFNVVGYFDEVSDVDLKEFEKVKVSIDGSAVELDQQMWDRFRNAGFWRSPSQRFETD